MFINLRKNKIFIAILLIFLSCNTYKYEYEEGLRNYINATFEINKLNGNYYIIELNNCYTCFGDILNLEYLNNHNFKNLTLIIIGESSIKKTNSLIKKLSVNYKILLDKEKEIYSYATGMGKPLLIIAKKNVIKFVKNIDDTHIQLLEAYLE